jgi:hypothetical protein
VDRRMIITFGTTVASVTHALIVSAMGVSYVANTVRRCSGGDGAAPTGAQIITNCPSLHDDTGADTWVVDLCVALWALPLAAHALSEASTARPTHFALNPRGALLRLRL